MKGYSVDLVYEKNNPMISPVANGIFEVLLSHKLSGVKFLITIGPGESAQPKPLDRISREQGQGDYPQLFWMKFLEKSGIKNPTQSEQTALAETFVAELEGDFQTILSIFPQ